MGRVSGQSFPPASQSWAEPVGEDLRESGAGARVRGREGDKAACSSLPRRRQQDGLRALVWGWLGIPPAGCSRHACPGHRAFSALSPRKLYSRAIGAVGVKAAPRPPLPSPAQPWTTQLWDLTGFSCEDLIPCVLSLHQKW